MPYLPWPKLHEGQLQIVACERGKWENGTRSYRMKTGSEPNETKREEKRGEGKKKV